MDFKFRRPSPADAPAIARVHCESWRTTYPGLIPAHVIEAYSNYEKRTVGWNEIVATRPETVWLVELDGEVVGFADGGKAREPNDGCSGQLYSIYLLHTAQRRGFGRELMRHVHADLRAAGHTSARVEVLKGNESVIAFYEESGAAFVREVPFRRMGEEMAELVYRWQPLPE